MLRALIVSTWMLLASCTLTQPTAASDVPTERTEPNSDLYVVFRKTSGIAGGYVGLKVTSEGRATMLDHRGAKDECNNGDTIALADDIGEVIGEISDVLDTYQQITYRDYCQDNPHYIIKIREGIRAIDIDYTDEYCRDGAIIPNWLELLTKRMLSGKRDIEGCD